MLFNSFDFGLFLIVVYLLYWLVGSKQITAQNIVLLAASYFFYGLWDWRFLFLIIASSLIDYLAGRCLFILQHPFKRKLVLWGSIIWNLGVLVAFKYYNFFVDNFTSLLGIENTSQPFMIWEVIIPLGLSFYTFQTMSYTIDVYRSNIKPTKNIVSFLCFVSFFPQLVAGPIERAKSLLPQFKNKRSFNLEQSKEGLRQIAWGLFKKMVIADNLAIAVNAIYATPEDQGSLSLLYATCLFFFQIYCDFSGYSDVAIGSAKLFGFKLSKNFETPYLAKTVANYWQRWHITLTKWFTDYLYGPIVKGTNRSPIGKALALFITMILIGLWHGANWTFVAFGLIGAVFITIERIQIPYKNKKYSLTEFLNKAPRPVSVVYISILIIISCVFFRAPDVTTALHILNKIVSFQMAKEFTFLIGMRVLVVPFLIAIEVFTRLKPYPLYKLQLHANKPIRWIIYYILIIIMIRYAGPKEQFIYFQF